MPAKIYPLNKKQYGSLTAMLTVTDVKAAGAKVAGVDIPDAQNVIASYPMATVKGGANPKGGAAFIDFVLSLPGQAILANYGFSKV